MKISINLICARVYTLCLGLIFWLTATQVFSAPGNPNEFGDQEWKAYCFNTFGFSQYRGYFVMAEEGFNTSDYFTPNQSPSTAVGYQGLAVAGSFYSISIKRRGFTCGEYSLSIPEYNWFGAILVDGVTVYSYNWSSGSQDNIWTGYLGPNSTVEYRYRMPFGNGVVSLDVALQANPLTTWTGAQNTQWSNAANWTNGVPNGQTNAVVVTASNQPILNAGAEVNDLAVQAGASLSLNEEELTVSGSFDLSGTLNAANGQLIFDSSCPNSIQQFSLANATTIGTLRLVGADELFVDGESCNIKGVLGVSNGHLETGDVITLVSDENGTARLAKVGDTGQITGDITVQRYINAALNGWVQLGTAVSGQTLANWSDDFITTGFPGSDYPSFDFNNIRMYDESFTGDMDLGLYGASDITNPITPGVGQQVYLAQGVHHVGVTGEPVVGAHEFDVSFHSSQPEFDADFSAAHDGWNLLSNPYPSAINWDSEDGWDKTNISGAIYVWDATIAQYNLYSAGVSLNGGSHVIPSSQAFWVQANGHNPALHINEEAKVSESGTFKSSTSNSVHILTLSGFGMSDQVAFRIGDASENASNENVTKFYSGEAVPKMGIQGEGEYDLAILGMNANDEIPPITLNQSFPQSGEYSISLSAADDAPLVCLFLEDLETGEWFDLTEGTYQFTGSEAELHQRFVLHFGSVFLLETQNSSCYGDSLGVITWNNPSNWEVNVLNLDTQEEVVATSPGVVAGMAPGLYLVDVASTENCGSGKQYEVVMQDVEPLSTQKFVSNSSCQNTSDGSASIQVEGGVSPYSILWQDGDTSFVKNNLSIGEHFYTLIDHNGCSIEEHVEVLAETTVEANFELVQSEVYVGELLQINNQSTGAPVFNWSFGSDTIFQSGFEPAYSYSAPGQYQITLIAQSDNCMDVDTAQVTVSEIVTATSDMTNSEGITIYAQTGKIVLKTELNQPKDVLVNVYALNGQELVRNYGLTLSDGASEIPMRYSGALIVQVLDQNQQLVGSAKVIVNE